MILRCAVFCTLFSCPLPGRKSIGKWAVFVRWTRQKNRCVSRLSTTDRGTRNSELKSAAALPAPNSLIPGRQPLPLRRDLQIPSIPRASFHKGRESVHHRQESVHPNRQPSGRSRKPLHATRQARGCWRKPFHPTRASLHLSRPAWDRSARPAHHFWKSRCNSAACHKL